MKSGWSSPFTNTPLEYRWKDVDSTLANKEFWRVSEASLRAIFQSISIEFERMQKEIDDLKKKVG